MLLRNKVSKIKTFMNDNNILTGEEECYCYAEDASNLVKSQALPDIVVFAESVEDIQKILKYAYENEIPVISRGAGTNMVGSCVCNNGGIILNFSKMNKIINIDTVNMTATVQPGVVLGDLKKAVENLGFFFPPDPSNYMVSTIGGAIAQSSGGALGFKYGTIKDYVLSLKIITSDGRLITLGADTPKDSSGYHLAQLMVGSEGTLAIIAEAVLKLIPKPEASRAVSAYFETISAGMKAVNNIIESKLFPAAIDFMDKNAITTVEDYTKCGLNIDKECLLLITLDGLEHSISYQTDLIFDVLKKSDAAEINVSSNEEEYNKIWNARRTSFAAAARLAPDIVTDDIIVPRKHLVEMAEKCKDIAKEYNLKMCLIGHAGDGNLHPQIALNLKNDTEFKNYMDARGEIYKEAVRLGGKISAEHGIGLEKKSFFVEAVDSGALEYMKMIKKIFDPKNILNPGKIL